MIKIPHLLLTAGYSRRMGQPKQLLPWGKMTLIEHQIHLRLLTGQDLIVVLGGHSEEILPVIKNLPVTVLVNYDWAKGMGSSLAFGMRMLTKKIKSPDGVLISLVDQPMVTTSHLENMIRSFQPGNQQIIVSESSSGWRGVPALFDMVYFEELKQLRGKEGARKIIQKHLNIVKKIECGELLEDIDTMDEYRQLLKINFP